MYLATVKAILIPSQAVFLGTFNGATTAASKTVYGGMPFVLNTVTGVGSTDSSLVIVTQFQALYIPKGTSLWAAATKQNVNYTAPAAPQLGGQGDVH